MIQIYEGFWKTYEDYILPFTVNLKLDESLDTASVQLIKSTPENYDPLTKVLLFEGNEYTEWLVNNDSVEQISYNEYMHTLDLIEPTIILKGYPIDNMTFTQPLTYDQYHNQINIDDVIDKLLKHTTNKNNERLTTVFDVNIDFGSMRSPEFFFNEYTLYDALFEVGTYVDSVPRVKFGTTKEYELTFDELDPKNKTNYTIEDINRLEQQKPLENYANQVVSSVSNLNVEGAIKYPPGDTGIYVDSGGDYEITDNNAVITLPYNIKQVTKFEVKLSTKDTYQEDQIFEYSRWKLYNPNTYNGMTPYYKYNGNKIENLKSWIESFPGGGDTPRPILRECLFRITFIPLLNTKVQQSNEAENEFTVIYNQKGNIINSDAYAENLNNYIKRMQNGDIVYTKTYEDKSLMPTLGNLINDKYVLTNMSYIRYRNYYDVTLQISEDYTRRAEFIRANQEIRGWEIPADGKVVTRQMNYNEEIKVSLETPLHVEQTLSIKVGKAFDKLQSAVESSVAALNFETPNGDIYYTILIPAIASIGNSLIVNLATLDNTLIGYNKSINWDQKVNNQLGVTYTDEYGNFSKVTIAMCPVNQSDLTESEIARNYPASTDADNTRVVDRAFIKFENYEVDKDARETFDYTYQLNYKGTNNTIVTKELPKIMLGQNNETLAFKVLFLDKTLTKNDKITSSDIINTKTVSGIIREGNLFRINWSDFSDITYNTVVLAYDNNVPLIIRNNLTSSEVFNINTNKYLSMYVNANDLWEV